VSGPWEQYAAEADGPWSQYAKKEAPPIAGGANPTGGFIENAVAATGKGLSSAARALGVDSALRSAGVPIGTKEDADRFDAPLMATAGGKVGNFIGTAAPAALAAPFTPATFVGAAAAGGLAGFGLTEGGIGDRMEGAAWGAGGGGVGHGLAALIGKAAPALQQRNALQAVGDQQRAANVGAAQGAGYVLPPNEIKRDLANSLTNAWSGQIKTKQAAAFKNQENTNRLAARALGLAEDQPLTLDAIRGVRQTAGQAYDQVRNAGAIVADAQFKKDLAKLTSTQNNANTYFPGIAKDAVADIQKVLDQPFTDASAAVDAMKLMRQSADAAFGNKDKALGKAYKAASKALEDLVERNLVGTPDALKQFREARTLMAKTYDVEGALIGETGNVSAAKLGAKASKTPGKFSGELKQIADSHNAFPAALKTLTEAPSNYSAVDGGMAAFAALSGNPLLAGYNAARPVVRSAILSGPGQRFAGMNLAPAPANALEAMLLQANRPALLRSLPVAGAAGAYGSRE
jgi:hypothetical protein